MVVSATALLCAALGAFNIGKASLWTDELFSRFYYDLYGPAYMLGAGLRIEPTPPAYAFLLKAWMVLFGTADSSLRSLSVVAYASCVPFVFLLGREMAGRRAGFLAALLFAISPMGLYFAQEARVYALTLLPCCVLLWASAVLLRDVRSRAAAAAYVITGTACLYLHASLLFLVAGCGIAGMCRAWAAGGPRRWRSIGHWVGINAAVCILSLPYTQFLVRASHASGLDWMPALSARGIASVIAALFTGMLTPRPEPALMLTALLIATMVASLVLHPPPARMLVITLAIPAIFFGLVCAVSLVRPVLIARILCWAVIPMAVLSARQILAGGWSGRAVCAAVLLAAGVGLWAQEAAPFGGKEPWRQAFEQMLPRAQAADLVVLTPLGNPLAAHAYAPSLINIRAWDVGNPETIMTEADRRLGVLPITTGELRGRIAGGQAVWLLANGLDHAYADMMKAAAVPRYDASYKCGRDVCVEVIGWGGH